MNSDNNLRPITPNINVNQKLTFISLFKPHIKPLLEELRGKNREARQNALLTFHNYYSQNIKSINDLTLWLSGAVPSYKLVDIRGILKLSNTKVVTRETKSVNLLVVGDKTKVEELPEQIPFISALAFEKILNELQEKVLDAPKQEERDEKLIELLLSSEVEKVEEAFVRLEEDGISLKVLPLMFAIFKVHKEKHIRTQAKDLLIKESSKTSKDAMNFCEKRNFLNAKYTVGMEELEKIKGFNIELFLYYLVLEQKNHLGKEYLASLDSDWTQKLIEEGDLLNQKSVTLYGKAGKRFVHAKKINSFVVHALSPVLWEMNWLKHLNIVDIKQGIVLPKDTHFLELESLSIETKELTLAGNLPIKELVIEKCKTLKIDESFKLLNIENIRLEECAFDLMVLKDFLEKASVEKLKKIEIYNFIAYKLPKDLEEQLKNILPEVEVVLRRG